MELLTFSEVYSQVHLPAKVVLAVTQKPDGAFNLITLEWFMRTSINPPMFAISIGHSRYSYECLEQNRFFNLVFPSTEMKEVLTISGSTSGSDSDKFATTGVKFTPGKLHKLPILSDAVANLECEVVTQIRSGDHTIFIGEVKYSWVDSQRSLFYYKG
ncbi:MAG TPA: flavin reductase family protein [Candidatus Cloacimonadota bacterium]|nr:flavin reductase family protein [Candidatus Cloacimonadota bacterium]